MVKSTSWDGVVDIYRSSQYLDPAASWVLFASVSPLSFFLSVSMDNWPSRAGCRRVLTVRKDMVESVSLQEAIHPQIERSGPFARLV